MNPGKQVSDLQTSLSEGFSKEVLNGNLQMALSFVDVAQSMGINLRVSALVVGVCLPQKEFDEMVLRFPKTSYLEEHHITLVSKLIRQQIEAKIAEKTAGKISERGL